MKHPSRSPPRSFRARARRTAPVSLTPVAALALLLGGAFTQASAMTFRVAPSGSDAPGCGTEIAPCRTIQHAINQIATEGSVLVAGSPGGETYAYDAASDICSTPLGTTGVACVVNKRVVLRGGFAPPDWTTSDPEANPTILDGGRVHRGVLAISTGPETTLLLEGFTIQNGKATGIAARSGLDQLYAFGGGLLADLVDDLEVRDVVFRRNRAVGDTVATEFGGAGSGGGAALRLVADATFERVWFEDNVAQGGAGAVRGGYAHGGGLYTFQSKLTGSALTFRGNRSVAGSTTGNGASANGERADGFGGAANFQHGSEVELTGVHASGNSATGGDAQVNSGGGFGGAIKLEEAVMTLRDAELRDNLAAGGHALHGYLGNGGAIETIHSTTTLERVAMVGNVARGGSGTTGSRGPAGGGALNVTWITPGQPSSLTMSNCIVAGNAAEEGPGTTASGGGGGGLWVQATTATITHTTIAGNRIDGSMQGQAVLLIEAPVGAPGAQGAAATFAHSIVADHTGLPAHQAAAVHVKPQSSATFAGGLFANDARATNADGVPAPAGSFSGLTSVSTAPSAQFVAAGPPAFDYHLSADSPALGLAASSTTADDVDGETRAPLAPRDAGADEHSPPGSIAGTVRDGSGAGVANAAVVAFRLPARARAGDAVTSGSGTYAIEDLAPGSYAVHFSDAESAKRFLPQWYDDRDGERAATPVAVASGATTSGIDATLASAPRCKGRVPTIVGTRRNDSLEGTRAADVISGADGNDEIDGGGGDDFICGGRGDDLLAGGRGNDTLIGGAGNDELRGDGGHDVLRDGAGSDVLVGGAGDDDLRDTKGRHNELAGGPGADTCRARAGDTLSTCEAP